MKYIQNRREVTKYRKNVCQACSNKELQDSIKVFNVPPT